jgi:hypothetical protein
MEMGWIFDTLYFRTGLDRFLFGISDWNVVFLMKMSMMQNVITFGLIAASAAYTMVYCIRMVFPPKKGSHNGCSGCTGCHTKP